MELYCEYHVERWLESEGDPDEWGDRDCLGGRYYVLGVSTTRGMRDAVTTAEYIAPGDEVWVVWVSYTDGDSLGYDGGYGSILVATKDEALAKEVKRWAGSDDAPWPEEKLGRAEPRRPWDGHFASPDYVEMKKFVVQGDASYQSILDDMDVPQDDALRSHEP